MSEASTHNFVAQQRSPNTARAYAADLRRFDAFVAGRPVTDELVIEWRTALEEELSNAAALRVFNTVRSYFKWANIEPNPFLRVKPPRRIEDWLPEVPNESDIDKVLAVCDNQTHRGILNLLNNGLRAQEVCDLKRSSVFFEESVRGYILRVIGKGMKLRLVPATDEVVASLANLALLDGSDQKLFDNLHTRRVYRLVDRYATVAGVEGMHPHSFRHAYATRLVRAGVNVFALQRLLGHASVETTAKYVGLDMRDLYDASRLDPRRFEEPRLRVVS